MLQHVYYVLHNLMYMRLRIKCNKTQAVEVREGKSARTITSYNMSFYATDAFLCYPIWVVESRSGTPFGWLKAEWKTPVAVRKAIENRPNTGEYLIVK